MALPGVDVYMNPGGLTVSNTGLIGFDDNGNGPAVLYDSGAGSFVETGLDAMNGHRQTRLSGDGRFLATTCVTGCEVDLGGDASAYVQDLTAKADTGFPDDLTGADDEDEEHPCVNADGSLVGVDITNPMQRDIFLYDRAAGRARSAAGPQRPGRGRHLLHPRLGRRLRRLPVRQQRVPGLRTRQRHAAGAPGAAVLDRIELQRPLPADAASSTSRASGKKSSGCAASARS